VVVTSKNYFIIIKIGHGLTPIHVLIPHGRFKCHKQITNQKSFAMSNQKGQPRITRSEPNK
jgi:hypothetical protein